MNKDIIYIEPSDDIASVISKIKTSSGKLIILVPPRGQNVLHNQMNIKLIVKTIHDLDRNLVFVTDDEALLNFAASHKIPVAPDLKTRPAVPSSDIIATENDVDSESDAIVTREEIADEFTSEPEPANKVLGDKDKTEEKPQKHKSKLLSKIPNFDANRKWFIMGGIGLVVVVLFLIWALVIAPSVKIVATISTVKKDFAESISLTVDEKSENIEKGVFYLAQESYEQESSVEFEATGERDDGEKATGEVTVSAFLPTGATVNIPVGTTFTSGGLSYVSTKAASLTFDGSRSCENSGDDMSLVSNGCKLSTIVSVAASSAGTNYNIGASASDWTSSNKKLVSISNGKAFTGGTSKPVKFVTKADIESAKEKVNAANESTGKAKLKEKLSDSVVSIESSYSMNVADPVSKPELNGTIEDGEKATLTVVTTFSIYTIDTASIQEFITAKAKISDTNKIYSLGNPFIERFVETDDGYTAKLKTSFYYGPKITENEIREKVYGVKIGEASAILSSDNIKIEITKTPFWVNSVPKNPNKVNVEIVDKNNPEQ